MTIMKIRGLQKSFGDVSILNNINLDIQNGDRIGIVGNNGSGKTTLANLIAGRLSADNGTIEHTEKSVFIGYLVQASDYSQEDLQESLTNSSVEGILQQTSLLGLSKVQNWDEERTMNLSGGEKSKLSLAQIWSTNPNLLILDEPTNHLDYNGVQWLIEEINTFTGAILIISHDRYFLDETVTQIIEIEDGTSNFYKGNYTFYRQEKEKRYQSQLHQYESQQKYKEKIEQQLHNIQNWSQKAHNQSTKQEGYKEYFRVKAKKMDKQVKSKQKRLERELEKNKIDKPKEQEDLRFHFKQSDKRGKRIVEAKDCGKEYQGRLLFTKSNFYLKHGERIGILGENGCGKTTLLRILTGIENLSEGELWKSSSLKIGYLTQDVSDLDETITAVDYLGLTHKDEVSKARTIFANIGLKEEKVIQPISNLSLGQRTRLKLVKILLDEVDLLILDEPTNHLDLMSRESLENMLTDFEGTILTVSHDTYFLQKMCDKLLVYENQQIKRIDMTLDEYNRREQAVEEKDQKEDLLLIENEISYLIGQLSILTQKDSRYQELDSKLLALMRLKRELTN